MRKSFIIATVAAVVATQAQAGVGSFIKKQIKQAIEALPKQEPQPASVSSSSPTSPQSTPSAAPVVPSPAPSVANRLVTRQDAHGHDYDAKTGLLICLAKPRKYKAGAYAMSYDQTIIPEGHNPNESCITEDRSQTKI
ncbi:hypothetical protein [Novosphingobium sp. CECT 9465]|uniref:hypothetical protein n=1 Tax=Novosphingobium sp. CECT 9465 TaxID=2829794 RepID=UPI001E5C8CC1|nr:hypothetical protein [Novosphingobium sp. CECT 9465]CAH0497226.1 hypothetical protein NVSP9465_02278 [Novosphingobium sp. CECT 9465]